MATLNQDHPALCKLWAQIEKRLPKSVAALQEERDKLDESMPSRHTGMAANLRSIEKRLLRLENYDLKLFLADLKTQNRSQAILRSGCLPTERARTEIAERHGGRDNLFYFNIARTPSATIPSE